MININTNIGAVTPGADLTAQKPVTTTVTGKSEFSRTVGAVGKYISDIDEMQQSSDMSVKDLLAGKNNDITSIVSTVAKADVSFKLLVGVRNKLIEAYKQTMNMPL